MYIPPELRSRLDEISRRSEHLYKFLDVPAKQSRLDELEQKMSAADFWNDQSSAQAVIAENTRLKAVITPCIQFCRQVEDAKTLAELLAESEDDEATLEELRRETETLAAKIDDLEIESFLSGKNDKCNAIMMIKAGAGGTEACDWAEMLMRLYLRWGERRGYKVEIEDMMQGEEAGVSTVLLRFEGLNAFGYAKAERGVHRLVRISPFDANKRRHTSFASVDVVPEIVDDTEIVIKDEDLRVDVYRASGAGGQHVNRTESAVRLTHLPTGIVVACQRERSQHQNRELAMRILKARIYEKMEDERRSEQEKVYGEKGEIGWGNQIRSYVFQPYQLVKDLRTGYESGNIQAVMDGEIDGFINAWLRAGGPRSRNKDIKMED
ncbi:MAG: peptide chain release factor 2 [Opitutales bacterium]|nr:peptide chain release factor 2 [Opitutales bacterium]